MPSQTVPLGKKSREVTLRALVAKAKATSKKQRNMNVLYNYREYENPRKAIFMIDTNEYGPHGWINQEEEHTIIGECDDSYTTKLVPSGHGEWVGDTVIQLTYILPIGIHKSRFVRWIDTQLNLFNN